MAIKGVVRGQQRVARSGLDRARLFIGGLLSRPPPFFRATFGAPPPIAATAIVSLACGSRVEGFSSPASSTAATSDAAASSTAVVSFRGVPYADIPSRTDGPVPVTPWGGDYTGHARGPAVRDCTRYGPACPQEPVGFRAILEGLSTAFREGVFPPLPPGESFTMGRTACREEEDEEGGLVGGADGAEGGGERGEGNGGVPPGGDSFLNLNISTPALTVSPASAPSGSSTSSSSAVSSLRPVVVWIHGGKFKSGSNIEAGVYDGTRLAGEGNVVVVAPNYRVGLHALHFPHIGEDGDGGDGGGGDAGEPQDPNNTGGASTNLALRDLLESLRWIKVRFPASNTVFECGYMHIVQGTSTCKRIHGRVRLEYECVIRYSWQTIL